jgi:hypothetical protein
LSTAFEIEAATQVTNAVISLDWTAGWNGGMVDRVLISAIDLDLDVDSNNDGEIAGDDDPIERDNPGRVIHVNTNDTNGNGTSDLVDPSPFVDPQGNPVADDLTPTELSVSFVQNSFDGFSIRFRTDIEGIRLWTNLTRSEEITHDTLFRLGTDPVPALLFIEGFDAGTQPELTVQLMDASGWLVAEDTVQLSVILVDLNGLRAEMPYFGRDFVPEAEEDQRGIGIRRNGDDDNGNGVADRLDPTVVDEDDLIELQVRTSPLASAGTGLRYVLFRGPYIRVWESSDKGNGVLTSSANFEQVDLNPTAIETSLWVEWADMTVPNASVILNLEVWTVSPHAAANNRLVATDTLVFYPFRSVVVALTGEQWSTGSDPITDSGVYTIASTLRDEGYSVWFADEDGVDSSGAGDVYDNVVRQIQGNAITQTAVFGHSHGGGSTHDLTMLLNNNRAAIGTFTIPFTGYLDAIGNISNVYVLAETRRPPTEFHTNIYQTNGALDGGYVDGADDNFDVTGRPGMTHSDLDDDLFVQDVILQRVFGKVNR